MERLFELRKDRRVEHRASLRDWLRKKIAESPRGTQSRLAEAMSLSPGQISKMLRSEPGKETREIGGAELLQMEAFFKERAPSLARRDLAYAPLEENDPNWRPDEEYPTSGSYSVDFVYEPHVTGALPEIDVSPGAGEGAIGEMGVVAVRSRGGRNDTVTGHRVTAEWLLPEPFIRNELHASPHRSLIMPVIGDSMSPTYQPGDRVMVDLNQNTLIADTVYVIDDRIGPPQIKRLQKVAYSDPPMVHILSDNPSHVADPPVSLARVRIIGRVCGHVARR